MGEVLKNAFSWSVSRDRTFRECPRQYWFSHYGSWGGWDWGADEQTREIYVLKQLKSRPMWVGEVVHECIRHSIENLSRGIPVLPVERILELTRNRMREDYVSSRDGRYRENPKHECGLFEHEYRRPVTDEQWHDTADHVDRCLLNFYRSEVWEQLNATAPADFLEIERLSHFMLDGTKVNVKLDCATRETDHVIVWDWKTGRRETADARLQLACYAFYLHQTFEVPIHRVQMRLVELSQGAVHTRTIAERELDQILDYVRGSIADMRALLDDREANITHQERFARVERPEICLRCNFLKVCRPAINPAG
jgi:CRISPR/Cas system-associated exonuclease Cas4 (RecB family)